MERVIKLFKGIAVVRVYTDGCHNEHYNVPFPVEIKLHNAHTAINLEQARELIHSLVAVVNHIEQRK